MSIKSFVSSHSAALHAIGDILSTVAAIVPLAPDDRAKVADAVTAVKSSAKSIETTVKAVSGASNVNVDKDAVKAVVAEVAPSLIAELVASELAKLLAPHITTGTVSPPPPNTDNQGGAN